MKQKQRQEIDILDTWDLTLIYENEEAFLEDMKVVQKGLEALSSKKKEFMTSAKHLADFLEQKESVDRTLEKIQMYAYLHFDVDTTNQHYKELRGSVENLVQQYGTKLAFFESALLKKNYTWFGQMAKDDERLFAYDFYMKQLYRYKKHNLSEKEEKLLALYSKSLSSSKKIFGSLTDGDMRFGTILDEKGEEVELNEANYLKYLSSPKQSVRRSAFQGVLLEYQNHIRTLTDILEAKAETQVANAKAYHYPSALEAALFPDNVSKKVFDNLIETVHQNLKPAYDYFAYKGKCLGLTETHLYDIYPSIVQESDKEYTFLEAKDLVLKGLAPLGEDYLKNLEKAFDERWMDIYPNTGKRKGAYSWGSYDTKPYLLLNFTGKLDDVFTLAHELGHSMHSYYSHQNNSYVNGDYQIFVAEVASTTNELLLAHYLLKNSSSEKEKRYILDDLLNKYKGTLFRQTMFAEFEKIIFEAKENGKTFTPEYLCDTYYELNKKYFGPDMVIDEEIRYEWARIMHFYHYNFYVYKYATGISAATKIARDILSDKPHAVENYLKFLSLGGSMEPLEELKVAGVDMTKPEVIKEAISYFSELLEEIKLTDKE